ncbi:MAG: glycoside hydrolase family 25 protein [Lachnospiraceae bacterium]|nr:glycoside hydrolase family 25 protein [Lachnospiraceae bacterium]
MKRMKNRTKLYMVLLTLGMILFALGIVTGILIGSISAKNGKAEDKEKEETVQEEPEAVEVAKPQVIVSDKDKVNVTNVYIPARERIFGQIPMNSYKTENFYIDEGFMAYHDDEGNKISHLGIDLSYHQEHVDFAALKEAGVEFVMLRCGYRGYSEGGLVKDEKFDEYAKACNECGIPMGVYFFTQSVNVEEAVREAEFTLDLIKDYKISYPVALDTEYVGEKGARTNNEEIDEALRSDMCIAFCEKIKEAGYYPMIYASENWIRRELSYDTLQDYDFWAPQYLEENDFMYDFTIWQYTEKGFIKGVDEQVDLDISMVDYASFVPALREAVLTRGDITIVSDNAMDPVPEW